MESKKIPMPGYGLTIIDEDVTSNGYDTPQTGKLIRLTKQDTEREFQEGMTYGDLIGKRIHWAKYSDADGTYDDEELNRKIVIIALDKLRGYEDYK